MKIEDFTEVYRCTRRSDLHYLNHPVSANEYFEIIFWYLANNGVLEEVYYFSALMFNFVKLNEEIK